MTDVWISITGTQSADGESDTVELTTAGRLEQEEDGGLFGDRGYVAYLGTKPEMNEIMARNIPAERMEQGPQMGGLT